MNNTFENRVGEEIKVALLGGARFEGFVTVGNHDSTGRCIPDGHKKPARLKCERGIRNKNDSMASFVAGVETVAAWCSGKGCCGEAGDRAQKIALAKNIFGEEFFNDHATLPLAVLVRQNDASSLHVIVVEDKVNLERASDIENYGTIILTFRGDQMVLDHFVEVVGHICGLHGHRCVGAVLYTDKPEEEESGAE